MTLTSDELQRSWVWKHRRSAVIACAVIIVAGAAVGSRVNFPWDVPIGLAMLAAILVGLRLMQLYHAPRRLKEQSVL